MFFLSLFFVLIVIQVSKDFYEQGLLIYQNFRFWIHLGNLVLISFITLL